LTGVLGCGTLRGMARRSGTSAEELLARIEALEERVSRIEAGRSPPGDGRAAAPKPRDVKRCPGCGLPLRRRRGRCAECGAPLE